MVGSLKKSGGPNAASPGISDGFLYLIQGQINYINMLIIISDGPILRQHKREKKQ